MRDNCIQDSAKQRTFPNWFFERPRLCQFPSKYMKFLYFDRAEIPIRKMISEASFSHSFSEIISFSQRQRPSKCLLHNEHSIHVQCECKHLQKYMRYVSLAENYIVWGTSHYIRHPSHNWQLVLWKVKYTIRMRLMGCQSADVWYHLFRKSPQKLFLWRLW